MYTYVYICICIYKYIYIYITYTYVCICRYCVRGDTHLTSTFSGGGRGDGKAKMRCYWTYRSEGLASVPDV